MEWAKTLPDGEQSILSVEGLQDFCHTYLIPDFAYTTESENYVRRISKELFEVELWSWQQDESVWPTKRDWRTFKKWFEIEIHSMVIDVSDEPIEREDL